MLDLANVRSAFPELTDIAPLGAPRSGQKDVLRAWAKQGNVVLKLIKPANQDNNRTLREIQAVARLSSDYVPPIYENGTRRIGSADSIYIIEPYIAGNTYREVLSKSIIPEFKSTLKLASVLLNAASDFEKANLVHRDIKPENIIISECGKAWVIDFGLVRLLDEKSLTATGQRIGPCTPGYGAPEQFRNMKSTIDIRADLFSIGVVLYESLSGENPYIEGKRDALEIFRSMEREDLPYLKKVDVHLADFVAALTARFPSRRPQNAREAIKWFSEVKRILGVGERQ